MASSTAAASTAAAAAARRYIDMFGDVVMNVDHAHFEAALSAMKQAKGVEFDVQVGS